MRAAEKRPLGFANANKICYPRVGDQLCPVSSSPPIHGQKGGKHIKNLFFLVFTSVLTPVALKAGVLTLLKVPPELFSILLRTLQKFHDSEKTIALSIRLQRYFCLVIGPVVVVLTRRARVVVFSKIKLEKHGFKSPCHHEANQVMLGQ